MASTAIKQLVGSLDVGQILPQAYASYRPLLIDGLSFFLERLPERRLGEIVLEQLRLDSRASFAERVLSLLHQCPTLHKLGQIVARDRRLSLQLRQCLQQLESVGPKTAIEEISPVILKALRGIRGIELSTQPLAEASVAMILPFTRRGNEPGSIRQGVFKLLKPGVEQRLHEELEIWSALGVYLEQRCEYHGLPMLDYRETLESVGQLLSREVCFELEQNHLTEAAAFYADDPAVVIPRLLPYCTAQVTAMERIDGEKVTETDLSPGDRGRFAVSLIEAMIARPFWALEDATLFHADPHAGNLFCTRDKRLAILDWTLVGRLDKSQRIALMQIVLGGMSHDEAGICRALHRLGRTQAEESRLRACVSAALRELRGGQFPGFDWAQRLLDSIALSNIMGFPENLMLFRKALLTLSSVAADITTDISIDRILFASGLRRFCVEAPMRVLSDPGSRAFATHISNIDLLTLWGASPHAASAYWLGAWQDYLEAFVRDSGGRGQTT